MLYRARRIRRPRRGTMMVVVALTIVILCGMTGLAVDIGRMAVCKTQIQCAADASALAGASALGDDKLILSYPSNIQTTEIATARTLAQTFAQANKYDLNSSSSVVLDKNVDVSIGVLATPITPSSAFSTPASGPYNSVQVKTYINSSHGGNLNLLFAPVLGQNTASIQATSVATVELHKVSSVKAISGKYGPILPITMSLSDYNQMINKQTGVDLLSYDSSCGSVLVGSDGLQEQQLYPGSNGTSSNNGLLQFGVNSHSNSVLSAQILYGPTYAQMVYQWPSGSPAWSGSHTLTIGADPGWRASNFDDLTSIVGQVRLIPINDGTSPGNGANGYYTIVAFAPVRIMSSVKGGNGKGSAMVQPAVITDPGAVSSTTLAGSGEGGIPISRLTR